MVTAFYLEQSTEQCHKFYEVSLHGMTIQASYGRIATTGVKKIYSFSTLLEAELFATRLLQRKLKRGYLPALKGQRFFRPRNRHPQQLQLPF